VIAPWQESGELGRGARRAPNLAKLCLVALVLPWAGGKQEKVVNPRGGFNPKPGVGQGHQATIGEMDKYDKSFIPEKTEKTALTIKMD
jgi:hypothetical protein